MSVSANYCIYPSGVGIIEEESKVCEPFTEDKWSWTET